MQFRVVKCASAGARKLVEDFLTKRRKNRDTLRRQQQPSCHPEKRSAIMAETDCTFLAAVEIHYLHQFVFILFFFTSVVKIWKHIPEVFFETGSP